jgi:hypothetical protein
MQAAYEFETAQKARAEEMTVLAKAKELLSNAKDSLIQVASQKSGMSSQQRQMSAIQQVNQMPQQQMNQMQNMQQQQMNNMQQQSVMQQMPPQDSIDADLMDAIDSPSKPLSFLQMRSKSTANMDDSILSVASETASTNAALSQVFSPSADMDDRQVQAAVYLRQEGGRLHSELLLQLGQKIESAAE